MRRDAVRPHLGKHDMALDRRKAGGPLGAAVVLALALADCDRAAERDPPASSDHAAAFLDTLQERTFRYFWEWSHPVTGLTPDRVPTRTFASVAATGFALTSYPIGIERGYVARTDARRRVLDTL
ncbi:MAG: hypothetical protein JSW67_05845, partial [Candidatus Latescibacterota bacterium]